MRILLVEDDEDKRRRLLEFLDEAVPEAVVQTSRSLHGGIEAIAGSEHDLVILDMTMPTFDIGDGEDGGRPQAYAGRELLRRMHRLRKGSPVVVVTQFDRFGQGADASTLEELDTELAAAHPEQYLGSVFYNSASATWKRDLSSKVAAARARMSQRS